MRGEKIDKPYSTACAWLKSDGEVLQTLSRSRRSDFARIAAMPSVYGRELDRLGAPLYLVRWVAGPGNRRPDLRERRYNAARKALLDGAMTQARFRELVAAHPQLEPVRGPLRGVGTTR